MTKRVVTIYSDSVNVDINNGGLIFSWPRSRDGGLPKDDSGMLIFNPESIDEIVIPFPLLNLSNFGLAKLVNDIVATLKKGGGVTT
jgi:hypothetical protein